MCRVEIDSSAPSACNASAWLARIAALALVVAARRLSAVTNGLPSRSPPIQLPGRRKLGTRSPIARSQR